MFLNDNSFLDFHDSRLFKTFSPVVDSSLCFDSCHASYSCSGHVLDSHDLDTMPDSPCLLSESRLSVLDSRPPVTSSPVAFGLLTDYFLNLHARIFASRAYNFEGLRLPVSSSLCLPVWRTYLREYVDYEVCDFLEFGWPVGFDYSRPLLIQTNFHNHKGATEFPDDVDAYLSSEITSHAVIGPFSNNPFSCAVAVSPLNSVPKPDTMERRIILDLSWPVGSSVNDGILSGLYLAQGVCSCVSYGGPDC